jgi:hypothetical protein
VPVVQLAPASVVVRISAPDVAIPFSVSKKWID